MELKNKVAIITGAGAGMGQVSALLFAKRGAKVVVNDYNENAALNTVEEIRKSGGEAILSGGDISLQEVADRTARLAIERYGKIDVLFNNAGVALPGEGLIENVSEEVWNRTIDVNLKGVFQFCKAVIPYMKERSKGSIINTSSMAGIVGTIGWDAYTAAKGGVIALSRALAVEYGPYAIRVNVLCPGVIRTAMVEKDLADPKEHKTFLDSTPLGRIGEPEEVAQAALFFASDASSFITGAVLTVDGGWTAQ
ncbi:MAG: SDR family NAD(P)-dependent oxidoreductase [Eubacteriales bacterium]